MPRFSVLTAYLLILLFNEAVGATPQVAFPINSQLPPVAYASQPFEFTFSSTTFSGALSDISYTVTNQPAWLSVDGLNRRLFGLPASSDVGAPHFSLIASDSGGQATSTVTLVILQERQLHVVNEDILPQLANAGAVSVPNTLVLRPQQSFAFTVQPNVFAGTSISTNFYAVSADRSPLPSWLRFDPLNIQFFGTAPPLLGQNRLQQTYTFSLIASTVVGFSEASVAFSISIADRLLVFTNSSYVFLASEGSLLLVPSFLNSIRIDGAPAPRDQIVSVLTNPPAWLRFTDSDLSFSGMPPQNFDGLIFSLIVGGTSTNKANTTIVITTNAKQNITQTSLGNISAIAGSYLSYTISVPPDFGANARITVNGTDLPIWLSFVASNNTLLGHIPRNASPGLRVIHFNISNGLRANSGYVVLTIDPLMTASGSLGSTISGNLAATSPVVSQTLNDGSRKSNKRLLTILLAILLPFTILLLSFGAFLAYWWRRKNVKKRDSTQPQLKNSSDQPKPLGQSHIEGVLVHSGSGLPNGQVGQKMSPLAHVELSWAPDSVRKNRNRFSKKSGASQGSLVGSSWDDLIDYTSRSRESLPPVPFKFFQRQRANTQASESNTIRVVPKRPSRPDSLILPGRPDEIEVLNSTLPRSVGLPKRLSAAGHGAGIGRSFPHSDNRSSWQTTLGSIPTVDRRRSTLIMSSFPQPPAHGSFDEIVETQQDTKKKGTQGQNSGRFVAGSRSRSEGGGRIKGKTAAQRASNQPDMLHMPANGTNASLLQRTTDEERQLLAYGSGIGSPPPVPQRSQARLSVSQAVAPTHTKAYFIGQHPINRGTSTASSRQFDSAVSSDSQWEDDSLVGVDNNHEQAKQTTNTSASHNQVLPRVPPRSITRGNSLSTRARASSDSYQPRPPDERNLSRVRSNIQSSERSDQGSFRFI